MISRESSESPEMQRLERLQGRRGREKISESLLPAVYCRKGDGGIPKGKITDIAVRVTC